MFVKIDRMIVSRGLRKLDFHTSLKPIVLNLPFVALGRYEAVSVHNTEVSKISKLFIRGVTVLIFTSCYS